MNQRYPHPRSEFNWKGVGPIHGIHEILTPPLYVDSQISQVDLSAVVALGIGEYVIWEFQQDTVDKNNSSNFSKKLCSMLKINWNSVDFQPTTKQN